MKWENPEERNTFSWLVMLQTFHLEKFLASNNTERGGGRGKEARGWRWGTVLQSLKISANSLFALKFLEIFSKWISSKELEKYFSLQNRNDTRPPFCSIIFSNFVDLCSGGEERGYRARRKVKRKSFVTSVASHPAFFQLRSFILA